MKIKSIIKQKWKTTRGKTPSLRVGEIVAIKIDKVDKASPLHSNVLITKILHVESPSEWVTSQWKNFESVRFAVNICLNYLSNNST